MCRDDRVGGGAAAATLRCPVVDEQTGAGIRLAAVTVLETGAFALIGSHGNLDIVLPEGLRRAPRFLIVATLSWTVCYEVPGPWRAPCRFPGRARGIGLQYPGCCITFFAFDPPGRGPALFRNRSPQAGGGVSWESS